MTDKESLVRALAPLLRRVRTDVTAVKKASGESAWTRESLTKAMVAKHLNGGPARGTSFIKAGQSVTLIGGLDFDSHKGLTDWPGMVDAARAVYVKGLSRGLRPVAFRSSGGRGIHLYYLFDDPQDAYSLRATLIDVLAAAGFTNGTKGVAAGQIEVFPKQDEVPIDGFGNQMILPLAGQSVPLDIQLDFEPMTREWAPMMPWPISDPVPQRERPARLTVAASATPAVPIAVLRSAAAAIPNEGDNAPDYDQWHKFMCAFWQGTGGSDEGLELAIEFSARNPVHNEKFLRERVWPHIKDRAGGITYKTLLHEARKCGWIEPHELWFENLDADLEGEPADAHQRLGWKNPCARPEYEDLTDRADTGNANLMVQLADGNARFVVERKVWMHWSPAGWALDETGAPVLALALLVPKHYIDRATDFDRQAQDVSLPGEDRKRLKKLAEGARAWALQCRNRSRLDALLSIASRDSRVVIRTAQLDRDPWLLGTPNGVVDLRTGDLRPAAREDLVTKRTEARYVPGAPAPRWRRFVREITGLPNAGQGDDPDCFKPRDQLAEYVQHLAGYLLTGLTSEHKLFIAIGSGSNGKNVLLDTMQRVAGDYWTTISPDALMATRHEADAERPSPAVAMLAGTRAAISSESRDGQRLDASIVKRHTGGGYLTARLMRENIFRFEMTHKLLMMTNHQPAIDHLDDAMRGRLHMIPFDRRWNRPGHAERDPSLPDGDKNLMAALADEAEGILAWMVEGAVAYHRQGLNPPAEVVRATRSFFAEADALGRWLATAERCDPREGLRTSEAFDKFRGWCSGEGVPAGIHSTKAFSIAVSGRGVSRHETAKGTRLGITTARGAAFD